MANKILLTPEIQDGKGAIYSKKPYPDTDAWIADLSLKIGNEV